LGHYYGVYQVFFFVLIPALSPSPAASLPDHFLPALLEVSLSGVLYLEPLRGAGGAVVDFTFAYLNPAAQRLLGQPARPAGTCLQCLPHAAGLLTFYQAEGPSEIELPQPAAGQAPLGRLVATRVGEGLLVSVIGPAQAPDGPAVQAARHQSEHSEQEANAETNQQQAQPYEAPGQRVPHRTQEAEPAQRSAEDQRQQLNELFMQAPAAIYVLGGAQWVFELVNPIYQQAFPGRALLGQPLLAALPELRATPLAGILAHVYATGETYQGQEIPVRVASSEESAPKYTYWTFTYRARRDGQGRIDGILAFGYEVTAQVQARQVKATEQEDTQALADQLQRTNEELRQANTDLDNFVHMASHDLKAPITNIEGLLHSLHQELALPAAEADTATVLRLMQDSVKRFQRTIHYLADMSKWQQATTQPARPLLLADLIEDVRLDLAPLLLLSGGQIVLAEGCCPTITFPEKQLRSIMFNLLSNALKYRSPVRAPYVQVRCTNEAGTEAVLEVEDNGLGLNPAQQAKIFGMFQRQHDHVEGSGVGLYLVKKVIDGAGGRVEVHSQPGVGSIFRISLPQ
jgi:signal transduction histidine kinase